MKKLCLFLSIILSAAIFCSCDKKITTYSFGPKENVSSISQEYKDFLQKKLNSFGKVPEGLSYVGYNASYTDDGGLIIEGFLMNNTRRTVYDIKGNITIKVPISEDKYVTIASADFKFTEEEFGKLNHLEARPWKLNFPSETIINNRDFSKFNIDAELTYKTE